MQGRLEQRLSARRMPKRAFYWFCNYAIEIYGMKSRIRILNIIRILNL